MLLEKRCCRCNIVKDVSKFHKHQKSKDGLYTLCADCNNKRIREAYHRDIDKSRKYNVEKQKRNSGKRKRYRAKTLYEARAVILHHYGGKCECCGETCSRLLTIDHINNDGCKQLDKHGNRLSGKYFYKWIVKNNYPTNLRLLCFNCNNGRQYNGTVCPHNEIRALYSETMVL